MKLVLSLLLDFFAFRGKFGGATFLTAGSISGTFATTNILGTACGTSAVNYSSTAVTYFSF